MNRPQPEQMAFNLSYVLHERSDSETVRRYVRDAQAERKRCAEALRKLAKLPPAEFERRLVALEDVELLHSSPEERRITSLNLGAIELLPRALRSAGHWPTGGPPIVHLLDAPTAHDAEEITFFGAPARLNLPSSPATPATSWLFATAVFRPGYASIRVRLTSLDIDSDSGMPDWRQAARLAEEAIREFPLQWWCMRPLWSRPVEEVLPEFRSIGNGVPACGR